MSRAVAPFRAVSSMRIRKPGNPFYSSRLFFLGSSYQSTLCSYHTNSGTGDGRPIITDNPFSSSQEKKNAVQHNELQKQSDWSAGVGKAIFDTAQTELKAEVERDAKEGTAALPPLAPLGWHVEHETGSSNLFMRKTIFPSDAIRTRPRFRSVLEEAKALHRKHLSQKASTSTPAIQQVGWQPYQERKQWKRTDAGADRFLAHLTIHAPFRVRDLSLLESKISITEHACFDVYVQKCAPFSRSPSTLTVPQQRVYDDREYLLLRLASVNSELRIRGIQFLSKSTEKALSTSVAFGRGDPLWLAVLAHHQRRRVLDSSLPRHKSKRIVGFKDSSILCETSLYGEYCRSMCYHGPYITDLSSELRDSLLTYIMSDLGITNEVVEYICQMQYFTEQEEYLGWLAQLGAVGKSFASLEEST